MQDQIMEIQNLLLNWIIVRASTKVKFNKPCQFKFYNVSAVLYKWDHFV